MAGMTNPTPPYDFRAQLSAGQRGEAILDRFFRRAYVITPASDAEQRTEIDRWFTNRKSGRRFSVEFKTDSLAGKTGNAFIETTSVEEQNKPGWATMSQAEYLIYFVRDPDAIYVVRFKDLRWRLPGWELTCARKSVANKGWTTVGLLVPLAELERCALVVWSPRLEDYDDELPGG